MINTAKLRELESRATKGDWRKGRDDMDSYEGLPGEQFANIYTEESKPHDRIDAEVPCVVAKVLADGSHNCHDDARFIAEVRNALPEILDWIDAARPLVRAVAAARIEDRRAYIGENLDGQTWMKTCIESMPEEADALLQKLETQG